MAELASEPQGCVRLTSGHWMPLVGLGTFQLKGQVCEGAVLAALSCGYRLIDTAAVYKNEDAVGRAIAASGVPREEIFITSKLSPEDQGEEKAFRAVQRSLELLQTSYIDLYLIHWPGTQKLKTDDANNLQNRIGSWRGLERAVGEGLVRSIGISNYTPRHVAELMQLDLAVQPSVNQVELHPLCQQIELRGVCVEYGIVVQAYTSLGQANDELIGHESVLKIARDRGCTPAQVLLRWAVQQGIPVIPRSHQPERIAENYVVQGQSCVLMGGDMEELNGLHQDLHFCWNPSQVL